MGGTLTTSQTGVTLRIYAARAPGCGPHTGDGSFGIQLMKDKLVVCAEFAAAACGALIARVAAVVRRSKRA